MIHTETAEVFSSSISSPEYHHRQRVVRNLGGGVLLAASLSACGEPHEEVGAVRLPVVRETTTITVTASPEVSPTILCEEEAADLNTNDSQVVASRQCGGTLDQPIMLYFTPNTGSTVLARTVPGAILDAECVIRSTKDSSLTTWVRINMDNSPLYRVFNDERGLGEAYIPSDQVIGEEGLMEC